VFLAADGELNLVDFAALPARGKAYLIERGPLLHYVSTERDLLRSPASRGSGLLAMGAPAFDRSPHEPQLISAANKPLFRGAPTTCVAFRSLRFPPLPASLREVHDIGALWSRTAGGDVLERTGEAANEFEFLQRAPGRRVLHLAAHAFSIGEVCPSAQLDPVAENPLLLSGIALAGANRRLTAGPRASDGILTAEEIAAMDLDSVEWAVLSACETGTGKPLAGEGVFGLRRAFQVAGARTVITSLWPVDDAATERWMIELYRNRFSGHQTTAEAVRSASVAMLARRRAAGLSTHPFHWSGFIAVGDWR
jgi:CHAT domain-containing protein